MYRHSSDSFALGEITKMIFRHHIIIIILAVLSMSSHHISDEKLQNRSRWSTKMESKIISAFPDGWSMLIPVLNTIPTGHHYCDDYDGVKGTRVTVTGRKTVRMYFDSKDKKVHKVISGKEALNIWLMPANYKTNWLDWLCLNKPKKATYVAEDDEVKIYAKPTHYFDPTELDKFMTEIIDLKVRFTRKTIRKDPVNISWKNWSDSIKSALEKYNKTPNNRVQ